jgi:cytochrome c-type biogenesis protein CcmH/NrfG
MRGLRISRAGTVLALVLLFTVAAVPALAQTGQFKGVVVDATNKPVERAKVTFVQAETNRKIETNTNRRGEFQQVGLAPGNYSVTAEKDGLTQTFQVKLGIETKEVNFSLGAKATAGPDPKEVARIEAIKKAFADGAALANEGKTEEAIAKFNEVIKEVPTCGECYSNIGSAHVRKQEWDLAEAAYKKAIEVSPKLVDGYNGLANVYNAQKKFKEAQAMSDEAAKLAGAGGAAGGAGNADALYNQGVIAWNGNDFAKAQELFSAAVKANEKHAEARFMLGQANLNLGKLPEAAKDFEAYLKLAPNGPSAEKAKSFYDSLKQYIK